MNHLLAYVIFIYTFQEGSSGSGQALLQGQGQLRGRGAQGEGLGLQGPQGAGNVSPVWEGQPGLEEPPQQHRAPCSFPSGKAVPGNPGKDGFGTCIQNQ